MIKTALNSFLSQNEAVKESPELFESVCTMLLVYNHFQPNIGYCLSMEKIAYFFRKLTDEANAWVLLHCTIHSSRLSLYFFEGRKTHTQFNLEILDKFILKSTSPKVSKKWLKINSPAFHRFFLQYAPILYLGIFDLPTVEKIADYLATFGEASLFVPMCVIAEEFLGSDLSLLSSQRASQEILARAQALPPLKLLHRLLVGAGEDGEFFKAKEKEIVT